MNTAGLAHHFQDFWAVVVEVWNYGIFGIALGKVIVAALILIFSLVLKGVLATRFMVWLRAFVDKKQWKISNSVLNAIHSPVTMMPVVIGLFLALEFIDAGGLIKDLGDKFVRAFILYIIFWGFYNLVTPCSFLFNRVAELCSVAFRDWLLKVVKFTFVFIGAAAILDVWGIKIGPILAGLGLFGVAVALGAQDFFKNLIAGLLIISEKRFVVEDFISIDGGVEGVVENIGFRSTLVRRLDKIPVYIPNSKLSDSALVNFTKMTHRRIHMYVGLEYGTTVPQLREIRDKIEKFILEDGRFVKTELLPTFVRVDRFSDSSIDMLVNCFTEKDVNLFRVAKEELAYKIKEIVEGAGTAFAFPSRTLYVNNLNDRGLPDGVAHPGGTI